uniref:P-type Ca(2+) transporter n=1 Tax=Macrostomum lignano TaxID=282301 RepID=A0A1I8J2V6_9PLAT
ANPQLKQQSFQRPSLAKASCHGASFVAEQLGSSLTSGLRHTEAERRLHQLGPNELPAPQGEPLWLRYLGQFRDPMIAMLLCSALVSLCMRQLDNAVSISLAIVIVVTVAFVQEWRSERALAALKRLLPHRCEVVRNGELLSLDAASLVPGDLVRLGVGSRVPADLRLVECADLHVDESSFTAAPQSGDASCELSSRANCAFTGTLVRSGCGRGLVVATGADSAFADVYRAVQEAEAPRTPLQRSMDRLGRQLSLGSLCIIAGIVLIGLAQGRPLLDTLQIGVSLAVAAIPEGLPIVVTVTLAIGVMRMARRNAVVKRLPAVETLGCVTAVLSDKTGTLTLNEMTAARLEAADGLAAEIDGAGFVVDDRQRQQLTLAGAGPALRWLCAVCAACNDVELEARGLRSEFRRLQEWPFNSDTKVMMVKCERPAYVTHLYIWWKTSGSLCASTAPSQQPAEAPLLLAKGAPDCLLSRCASYWAPSGQPAPMTSSASAAFAAQAARMGARGLRVLAAAAGNAEQPEGGGLVFCGLVGLLDPPRPGVREAVACLRESGVLVAMVTGDSAETACAVARQIGLAGGEPGDPQQPLSGDQLDGLPAGDPRIAEARIFYRTSPRHKSKIVRAFQAAGRVVAMTGDGVNDAVALKAADIGVAMGRSGTEVAMEAADMILTDDSFRTILSAVEEGKAIFHNIRCFIRFQLSTSVAALSLVAMATLFSLPSPLNAMQILWINILMDGPPAQSLGLEPLDPEIRRRPPRRASEPVLPPAMLLGVLRSAAVIVAGTLFVFYREMSDNRVTPRDTTMTFTCFVLFDMFNALSCRSKSKSVFSVGLLTNRAFCLSVGMSLVGQLLVIYCPPFQAVFQTEALSAL